MKKSNTSLQLISFRLIILISLGATFLLHNVQQCGSHAQHGHYDQNGQLQQQLVSTYFENEPDTEPNEDFGEEDDEGGRNPSTAYSSNGRYHRSTTTGNPNFQPFFGQSSTNYVPAFNSHNTGRPSDTAIRFPDLNVNASMMIRGGVHGGNTMHNHPNHNGARRGRIPLNLLRKLSSENDVTQIFAKYVSNVKVEDVNGQKLLVNLAGDPLNVGIGGDPIVILPTADTTKPKVTGFTGLSDRTKPAAIATAGTSQRQATKHAGCEPELQTVELPPSNDPSVVQFPRCVRLERCGGCCASELLSCEPIRTVTTQVQVQSFFYNDGSGKLDYKATEAVPMLVDVSCRCNCKVKSADCTSRHEYSSDECACICKNNNEYDYCLRQSHKLWDPNLCQCLCREILACSSGFSFSLDTCLCARIPVGESISRARRRSRRN